MNEMLLNRVIDALSGEFNDAHPDKLLRAARTVLASMQEADASMTYAMASVVSFTEDSTGVARDVWRAGVMAAMSERHSFNG